MNTNPSAIKVLCYGDSNTWGQKPDKSGRYTEDVRWTGVLQKLLGDSYYIIEEGLGSRTTDLEYDRKPGRNGKTYLQPCLESHSPLDIVVLMLGTNDLKIQYGRSAQDVAAALEGLVDTVRQYAKNPRGETPKIILVSPILINPEAPDFSKFYADHYDERSGSESKLLAQEISKIADKTIASFIDASQVSQPGTDGIHFSEASEAPLAELIAKATQSLQ
jgi:lysophospholipase L1-like esterase